MSQKYKARELQELYFITVTIIDWVDLLTRPIYKDVIIDSLKYCQQHKGLHVHAYVIMTNHFHAIVSSDVEPLQNIIRDLKKHTSKLLIKTIESTNESRREWMLKKFRFAAERVKKGANYKIWKDGFHPVHLSTNEMIDLRLEYIHKNPITEGLVRNPHEYIYSSAGSYSGLPGLISLKMID